MLAGKKTEVEEVTLEEVLTLFLAELDKIRLTEKKHLTSFDLILAFHEIKPQPNDTIKFYTSQNMTACKTRCVT